MNSSSDITAWNHLDFGFKADTLTPFSEYIRGEAKVVLYSTHPVIQHPDDGFPKFSQLPAEIQLHFLDQCDPPTLFSVMHTIPHLRVDAKERFWTHPDQWYVLDLSELAELDSPGEHLHAADFASHVQQVEIDAVCLDRGITRWYGQRNRSVLSDNERRELGVHEFWRVFCQVFPSCRRIVCTDSSPSTEFAIKAEWMPLVQSAPAALDVKLSATVVSQSPKSGYDRLLFKLDEEGEKHEWQKVNPNWTGNWRIQMPPKKFYGALGDLQELAWRGLQLDRRRLALWTMRIIAVPEYHFSGGRSIPFTCQCAPPGDLISSHDEWMSHLKASDAHKKINVWEADPEQAEEQLSIGQLPQSMKDLIRQKMDQLWNDRKAHRNELQSYYDRYTGTESERVAKIEEDMAAQQKGDPNYRFTSNPTWTKVMARSLPDLLMNQHTFYS
jgi:hypothetical protein